MTLSFLMMFAMKFEWKNIKYQILGLWIKELMDFLTLENISYITKGNAFQFHTKQTL